VHNEDNDRSDVGSPGEREGETSTSEPPAGEESDPLIARDAEERELLAMRREEREAELEERELERRLAETSERARRTREAVEAEYRREHHGRPPNPAPPETPE
jgi:hypothetical protein